MSDIKMYVADLAVYNNGHLHGIWIDATLDLENILKSIRDMLKISPIDGAEEYAIHDCEGFGKLHISEYKSLEVRHDIAKFIAKTMRVYPGSMI